MITLRKASFDNPRDAIVVLGLVGIAILNTPQYTPEVRDLEMSHHTIEMICERIDDGLCVLAIDEDGECCGMCFGEDEGGVIWLSWIAVLPSHYRQKIGSYLIEKFVDVVRGEGTNTPRGHKIACASLVSNTISHNLLTKSAFIRDTVLYNHWHCLDFELWSLDLLSEKIKRVDDRFVCEQEELVKGLADGSINMTVKRLDN